MIKHLLSFSLIVVLMFSISCKGPEGEVGPKGDTGVQGPAGASGPAGKDGESVGGGGAYVFLLDENVETEADGSTGFWIADFFEGYSDDEILSIEKGSFQVYVKEGGVHFPIPGLVFFKDDNDVVSYSYLYQVEGKGFGMSIYPTSSTQKLVRTLDEVRILFIPAIILNGRKGVNWSNYEEAVKVLGIAEKDVERLK